MTAQTVALIVLAVVLAVSSTGGITPNEVEPVPPPEGGSSSPSDLVEPPTADESEAERPIRRRPVVLGYYMQDTAGSGRASLMVGADVLTAVAPWSWGLTDSGQLRTVYFDEGNLAQTLSLAGGLGLETHVLIHNFNPDKGVFDTAIAEAVLAQGAPRSRAVENIAAVARSWDVTGVHIDFEGVAAERRNDLTSFMEQLQHALSPLGVALSIAVPAKTFATADAPWTRAYDYEALARHADFVMIMAYDQHWPGGPPGPVAALPWVREVVEYALSPAGGKVPSERIVLGMAAYGYDWPLDQAEPGQSVTFADTVRRLRRALAENPETVVQWHEGHKSPYLDYSGRQIWFENAGSLSYKLQLAAEYDLGGVALWRLGQEDPALWSRLAPLD